jgi:hypothetical protein
VQQVMDGHPALTVAMTRDAESSRDVIERLA